MISKAKAKSELLDLLKTYSYTEGDFTLSSGKKSNYYLDCKRTLLRADGHRLVSQCMFSIMNIGNYVPATLIAGVELGGCSIASALSTMSYGTNCEYNAIYIRKEEKEYGAGNLIEGLYSENEKVVLVEDVVTTGKSTLKALNILTRFGLNPIYVISVIDRLEGGKEAIQSEYPIMVESLFSIDNFRK